MQIALILLNPFGRKSDQKISNIDLQSYTDNLNFKTANKVRKIVHISTNNYRRSHFRNYIDFTLLFRDCDIGDQFLSCKCAFTGHFWAVFSNLHSKCCIYLRATFCGESREILIYRCYTKQWYTKLLISDRCLQYAFMSYLQTLPVTNGSRVS